MRWVASSNALWGCDMALRKPALSAQEARRLAFAKPEDALPSLTLIDKQPVAPVQIQTVQAEAENPPPPAPEPAELAAPVQIQTAQPEAETPPSPIVVSVTARENPPEAVAAADVTSVAPQKAAVRTPSAKSRTASFVPAPLPAQYLPSAELRMQVFISAHMPAPGFSPSFDMLCTKHRPAKALQMILRKAMDEYEDRIADGSFVSLPEDYPSIKTAPVQTSRIMPQELIDLAKLHFDPLGFESARAFGLKIASAALAHFFAREKARR